MTMMSDTTPKTEGCTTFMSDINKLYEIARISRDKIIKGSVLL